MRPFSFASILINGFLLSLIVSACSIPSESSEQLVIGTDPAADPATLGYTINHFALVVNDIDKMMDFYGRILGLRHIFTFHASPAYQITYMGHAHGGKNGTGFQHGSEMLAEKTNIEGLIEFLYFKCHEKKYTPSSKRMNTFGHVGLIVPNIEAAQARMKANGIRILKAVDKDAPTSDSDIARAFGIGGNGADIQAARVAALQGIRNLGFNRFLIVEDPDGNLLEIQPQY